MERKFFCPQCGEDTPDLHEGYCRECCDDNQRRLDRHNAEHDAWQAKTSAERDAAIRDAVRRA
jgi:ribosomal protein L37E